MATAVEKYQEVKSSATENKYITPRQCPAASAGDIARQGDVYIRCLPCMPFHTKLVDEPKAQVATGNTKGSRHCIRDLSKVKVYEIDGANALQGPVIDAPNGFELDHGTGADDDHASCEFGPGVYLITFQRAYATELMRAQD